MRLFSLYASSFKKLKFDEPLRFQDGVTVISGLNESGKSTILDAILYALYGRVTRPPGHVKNTDIIGYGTDKATVILEFEVSGHTYRVKREIHRNRANTARLEELLPDGRPKPLATQIREVTSIIEGLLGGITFNEIIASNIVAQKDLDRLVKEGSDRRRVINAFLNLESFNAVLEKLNEERKDLEGTGPSRPGMVNIERGRLEEMRSEMEEFNKCKNEAADLKGKVENLSEDIKKLESQYIELESLHSTLTRYSEAVTLKNQLAVELEGKKRLLESHRAELDSLTDQIQILESSIAEYANLPPDETVSEIEAMLTNIQGFDRQSTEAERRANSVAEDVKHLEEELRGFDQREIERVRRSKLSLKPYAISTAASFLAAFILFAISNFILSLIAGVIGAILLARLYLGLMQISRLARLEGLLGKAELLEGRRRELSGLKNEASNASEKSAGVTQLLKQTLKTLQRYEILAKQAEGPKTATESILSQFYKDRREKDSLDSSIRSLKSSQEEATRRVDISKVQSEIDGLEGQMAEIKLPQLPDGVEFSKEILEDISRKKEGVNGEIMGRKATVKSHLERIDEDTRYIEVHKGIGETVESQEEAIQDLERKLRVVRVALEGIEKTAETLRMRVRPGVESYMGQILPSITSGRYRAVTLDDEFRVQVWDPEAGEFRPKEVFSGGTEDQLLLAMRLAFALALMPEVKGTKPDFLFLDEPLASSDEVRRSGIIEYINTGLSRLFSQIFIISHVGSLEELVPNVIRLDNGRIIK